MRQFRSQAQCLQLLDCHAAEAARHDDKGRGKEPPA